MSIAETKKAWSETFEKPVKVLHHVQNCDTRSARELCVEMLRRDESHLFYKVKYNIMLAGLADIPPVTRNYFGDAEQQCKQLYESRKPPEEEEEEAEILTYQTIITEGPEDLVPEEN